MLCHAMPCYMLCYAMLCYAMLYAMLCYAMLCYAMLCYAMGYIFGMKSAPPLPNVPWYLFPGRGSYGEGVYTLCLFTEEEDGAAMMCTILEEPEDNVRDIKHHTPDRKLPWDCCHRIANGCKLQQHFCLTGTSHCCMMLCAKVRHLCTDALWQRASDFVSCLLMMQCLLHWTRIMCCNYSPLKGCHRGPCN